MCWCLFKQPIFICFRKTNFDWLKGWKNLFTNLFYNNINWPKNLFTNHNFQQKTYLPNIFSAKKTNLVKPTEKIHQTFCIKHVLIKQNKLKKKNLLPKHFFPARNCLTKFLFNKNMCYCKNYLKKIYIFLLGAFHILCQPPMGGGQW